MAVKTFTSTTLSSSDVNTYLANAGLVYITSATASNSAYLQIDNCFTSTYDDYRVTVNIYSSVTSGRYCHAQLTVSGTPTATGYISKSLWYDTGAGNNLFADYDIQTTKFALGPIGYANTGEGSYSFDLFKPKVATNTRLTGSGSGLMAGAYYISTVCGGIQTGTTSFDGLRILPSASNLYATATIFGYRKP